jgi:hypothetical protein
VALLTGPPDMTEHNASITCERCGTLAPAGSKYCESCGTRLPEVPQPIETGAAGEPLDAVYCEQCGARNNAGSQYCESCGRSFAGGSDVDAPKAAASPPPPDMRRRRLLASAAVILLFAVGIGVVVAVTRHGKENGQAAATFAVTTGTTEDTLTNTSASGGDSTGFFPSTDSDTELDAHIPTALSDAGCETDSNTPADALAGAVCPLTDRDLVVQYWLFADSASMYTAYDKVLSKTTQVTDGGCPDQRPTATEWTSDNVVRGRWACYLTVTDQGDDAHIVWTHEGYLILGILSHISTDSTTDSLLQFWGRSAGPV